MVGCNHGWVGGSRAQAECCEAEIGVVGARRGRLEHEEEEDRDDEPAQEEPCSRREA